MCVRSGFHLRFLHPNKTKQHQTGSLSSSIVLCGTLLCVLAVDSWGDGDQEAWPDPVALCPLKPWQEDQEGASSGFRNSGGKAAELAFVAGRVTARAHLSVRLRGKDRADAYTMGL